MWWKGEHHQLLPPSERSSLPWQRIYRMRTSLLPTFDRRSSGSHNKLSLNPEHHHVSGRICRLPRLWDDASNREDIYTIGGSPPSRSTRFIVFDRYANIVAQHQIEFPQYYPEPG